VVFNANGYSVDSLLDESNGVSDTTIAGKIKIYLYRNGSNTPTNSSLTAIQVMQSGGLIYQWDSTKLMSNCALAIIHLSYSQTANITGIAQTRFQITNSRKNPADCFYDYLINTRYGAAIPLSQINTASLDILRTYSNELITFTPYSGGSATQKRFEFNGSLDTTRTIMQNLQDMTGCCDALLIYNEIFAQWGVITQKSSYTIAMALNDSNIVSAMIISPIDLANSFNVCEVKFPDESNQDTFNSSTLDLAVIDPALLFPNEPVNKQSISLPFVNNNVTAQLLGNRFLKSVREDLQVQLSIDYTGIQLEAGDIVTITNANYGWAAKLFRINKITEVFGEDGSVIATLALMEFNPAVYDDASITQFTPAPNTGIGDPTFFGIPEAPDVISEYPTATNPSFVIQTRTTQQGIAQYAEIWYSAFTNPLQSQMYFAGTSEIQSNGNPWSAYTLLPNITLTNIPTGNWYFFSRMVNSLASSAYSPASDLLQWRPSTYQFTDKYLNVAYADNINGGGFDLDPRGHSYYGLYNTNSTSISTTASDYTWYLAPSAFNSSGALIYLLYSNRTGRKFSFSSGFAAFAATTGSFVPTSDLVYPPSIWAGLPDGTNNIDLDQRTGQLIQTGTTSTTTGELLVSNNAQGGLTASLYPYLQAQFGEGVSSVTSSVANLTIDVYGRVIGFETPDNFSYTQQAFVATSSQTVFTVTRGSGYIANQCWVMKNGCLLDESEYTDTSGSTGTVTLATGAITGDIITITSFKSISSVSLTTTAASGTGSVATLTFGSRSFPPFTVGQSITVTGMTPSGYNGTYTVTACTKTTVSFASTTTGAQTVAGNITYTNNVYQSFSRNGATLTNQATYTASGFTLISGTELLFLNGAVVNSQDYDITGQDITFIGNASGDLQIIQWYPNNLAIPNGSPTNVDAFTIIGQTIYPFSFNINAFNLFSNGVLFKQTTDYTVATGSYTLSTAPLVNTTIMTQQTFARTGAV
jgi:hypothetical protein